MKKVNKLLGGLIFSVSLVFYSCAGINPLPSPSASSSAQPSESPSSSPTNNPNSQYQYDFPLKVTQDAECNLGNKTIYQVESDGTFSYFPNDNEGTKAISRLLTTGELTSLKNLLQEIDLASLAEKDNKLPSGSPTTDECRTIENYTMRVNDREKTFDRNARLVIHTEEYTKALDKLDSKLEQLKNSNKPAYIYDFPLRVTGNNECAANAINRITYEIKPDGTFSYLVTSDDQEKLQTKHLTTGELKILKSLIDEIDLAKLAEGDKQVPPGTPQTEECRRIEVFTLLVNDVEKGFDRNGRLLIHTQQYLDSLEKLRDKLDDLKK